MSFGFSSAGRLVQPGGEVCRFGEGARASADAAGGLSAGSHQPHDPAPRGLQRLHTGRKEHIHTLRQDLHSTSHEDTTSVLFIQVNIRSDTEQIANNFPSNCA